jgi:hypothetical protein
MTSRRSLLAASKLFVGAGVVTLGLAWQRVVRQHKQLKAALVFLIRYANKDAKGSSVSLIGSYSSSSGGRPSEVWS